ncbi:hypothetical protein HYV86_07875 [Candidatus Woesearchaeota archaeon]|nr:hypothetical protein [Candidatus Woesearchaeota archaeon]
MKRKVVKLGPSTLVISLPSEWIKKSHISPGIELDVEEVHHNLLIKPPVKQHPSITITLHDEADKKAIYSQLSHLYRVGFDKITINFTESSSLKRIQHIVSQNLLGFEITKKTVTSCIIESITEPTDEKFQVLLRRVFLQIKETQELVREDFTAHKELKADELEDLRASLDRHIFFCRRLISKGIDMGETPHLVWELLTFLMHIQHAYYYMYGYYKEHKQKVHKETLHLLSHLELYFDFFYKAYFEKKEEHLVERRKERIQIQHLIFKQLESANNPNKVILGYLQQICRLMQVGISPVHSILVDEKRKNII